MTTVIEELTRIAETAGSHWDGGFSDIALIKHRENAVFSARRPDGTQVAIRLHRAGYHSSAALHSELAWMQAIGAAGAIDVPTVVPASDGRLVVEVGEESACGSVRQVSVLGWLSGRPAGTSEDGVAGDPDAVVRLYGQAGALAARLHDHSSSWVRPDGFTRPAWDAEGLVGDSPLWGRFWEYDALTESQRGLLLAARDRARIDLARRGCDPAGYGLIHADLVPENLLDDAGTLQLIDFDDAGFGWFGFELATALYFNRGLDSYPAVHRALIDGYRTVRPFTREDEECLPLFLFLRGTTYLGWVGSRPDTDTARELGPQLIQMACEVAEEYLAGG